MSQIKFLFWYIGIMVVSFLANLMIKVIPFKLLIGWITNSDSITDRELLLTNRQQERLFRAADILKRIRQKVPWRVYCFEQAIVALVIARILGVNMNIYFGVQKNGDKLLAHAWTMAGNDIFTGKEEMEKFVPVYSRGYRSNKKGEST